jgi:hypothetical protein
MPGDDDMLGEGGRGGGDWNQRSWFKSRMQIMQQAH